MPVQLPENKTGSTETLSSNETNQLQKKSRSVLTTLGLFSEIQTKKEKKQTTTKDRQTSVFLRKKGQKSISMTVHISSS